MIQPQPSLPQFVKVRDPESDVVRRHLADWSLLPDRAILLLKSTGVRVLLGNGSVTSFPGYEHLRGVHPRGWPEGSTWDEAPAMYDRQERVIIAGGVGNETGDDFLHEVGHALGHVTGGDDSAAAVQHHRRLFDQLEPYLQQGGAGGYAGRHEMFADGVAQVLRNEENARLLFDDEFVDWLLLFLRG